MASAPQASIASLQAGRGLAALAVTLFHAQQAVGAFVAPLPPSLAKLLSFGYLGVDFFFVLSGFIIYYTNVGRVDEPGWMRRYAVRRLSRIYFPYLPIGVAVACAYWLLPEMRGGTRQWNWLTSLTLAPVGKPALGVAWTLQHELVFYLFAGLLLRTRCVLAGAVAWGAIILGWAALVDPESGIAFALVNLEFLFGIAVAWAFLKGRLPSKRLSVALGLLGAALFFLVSGVQRHSVIFGCGLAFLVGAAVKREAQDGLRVPDVLLRLGDASYSIYLVHLPLMAVAARALGWANLHWALSLTLLVGGSVAAGIAYHAWLERPLLQALRSRGSSRLSAKIRRQSSSESSPPDPRPGSS